jgi:hypothetical protein
MAAERTLTRRQLNRALLERQLLLRRGRGSLPRTLERVGGIQAQYAPSMYVGLWARLEGFRREALTRALERRTVVQGTLMRATIHLVSSADYWPLAVAVRDARRKLYLRSHRDGPDAKAIGAAARRLGRRLAGGPLARKEVDEVLAGVHVNGAGLWLDLLRVPPSGTWERRRADIFAAAEEEIGPPPRLEQAEALAHLIRRYLAGFGPATRHEIASFAGVSVGSVDEPLERLRLRRFRAEDGAELLDLPRAPLPDPETPAPPRLLPVWDATLLVHARRTGVLPEEHRPRVFNTRTPQSVNTFLVDGEVAGTWREEKGRVTIEPFGRLDRSLRRELDQEAERLAGLY